MGQKGRGDALPLAVGHDGDIHDLGREGPRVDQHVLSDDPAVVAGGVARSAADVVGHRGFDLVGQQQQFPRRGFGFANFHIEKYINYAFESMRLLRENRKLFISYRRTDSSAVANQLFDAFVRNNYDVFLDTYSINPAKNFQEELHHRMTDCDVLIQLYTNDFKNSKWCNEEIISANQKQIGVVEIIWPDCTPDIHNLLCEPIQLTQKMFMNEDFHNGSCCITEECIENIVNAVESVRARNLAARQDNLVGEFVEEARKQGRQLIQEYRYLVETLKDDIIRLFIPAIGIPQSYDCFDSLRFRKLLDNEKIELFLIYDDLRIRKKWVEHLEWLNESLEVKTIKKKDFELWLKNN